MYTFLCCLKCAFWQSLLQYVVLWHFVHCFGDSGDLPHCAHVVCCGEGWAAEEDEAVDGSGWRVALGVESAILGVKV